MFLADVLQGILMTIPWVALKGMCLIPCAAHCCGLGAFPSLCFSWGHVTNKQVPVGNDQDHSCWSTKPINPEATGIPAWLVLQSVSGAAGQQCGKHHYCWCGTNYSSATLCCGDPIAFSKDLTVKPSKIASVSLPPISISCSSPCLEGWKRLVKCILERELLWIFSEVTLNSLEKNMGSANHCYFNFYEGTKKCLQCANLNCPDLILKPQ